MAEASAPAGENAPPGPLPGAADRRQGIRPLRAESVYLFLALTFGAAFLVLTPPYQVPDEPAHFRRAFEISEGRIIAVKRDGSTGDEQPRALDAHEQRYARFFRHHEQKTTAAEILGGAAVRIDPDDREFDPFPNAAIHPPLTYLPQAAAIFLTRHLVGSVLVCIYAGRLANLLAAVAVTFLAVRRTPAGKWAFAALALTPMAISLSASLSPDALTNALSFLLIAQVLALALGKEERISGKSLAVTALLGAAVGLAKQAYFLLPLCYLMIPARKSGGLFRHGAGLAAVMGATLLAVGGWGLVVREIYSPADPQFGMNPAEQFRLMCRQPGEFLLVVVRTLGYTPLFAEEFVGWLGFADIPMAGWVYVVALTFLVAVCAAEFGPGSGVTGRQALVAAGVTALVAFTVLVIMHLTWDAVGAPVVSLQGRYFIPVAPLAGLALGRLLGTLARPALAPAARVVRVAAVAAAPLVLAVALARVHGRFFEDTPKDAAERAYVEATNLSQKAGQESRARELFEEAARVNPLHAAAHADLGNLLARQGDFSGAIGQFREALRLKPEDADVKRRLDEARGAQQVMGEISRQIPPVFHALIGSGGLSEERHPNSPKAASYLKPNRGPVTDAAGRAPFPVEFLWRCPPPSGEEIRLTEPAASTAGRSPPFFACSAGPLVGPRRVFVFPPPVNVVFLADDAVSWYYQRPLADLSEAERAREQDYRRERGLHFPLATLP
jgi:uncharacterized membrane protein/tetratricopeptide (TPR) repeat protein